jgi:hypothetical protein
MPKGSNESHPAPFGFAAEKADRGNGHVLSESDDRRDYDAGRDSAKKRSPIHTGSPL